MYVLYAHVCATYGPSASKRPRFSHHKRMLHLVPGTWYLLPVFLSCIYQVAVGFLKQDTVGPTINIMENSFSDNFSLLQECLTPKIINIHCGTRAHRYFVIISGFRNNRGQKSADLVIS